MAYFIKIENSFIQQNFENLLKFKSDKLTMEFIGSGTHLEYFELKNYPEFFKIHTRPCFKILPDRILFAQISGQGILGAHVDRGTSVTLNYYIEADNDETIFYERKLSSELSENNQMSNIFLEKDLTPKESFIARTGDIYLLDVNKIHSVAKNTSNVRKFISYQWEKNTFEEVRGNLQ